MNIWNDHFLDSSHHHQIPPLTIDLNDELVEEVDEEEHQFFSTTPAPKYNYSQPSSSSSSSQTFFFPPHDHGDHHNPYANQLAYHNYHEDHQGQVSAPQGGGSYSEEINKHMGGINENQNVPNSLGTSVKWMSSKMRIMRKMMSPVPSDHHSSKQFYNNYHEDDHKQASTSPEADHSSSNVTIRVCSDCNTTKTPLWRSGPRGPKSLCNACGIRQRKARRAAMAAAAAAAAGNGSAAAEIMTAIAPNKSKLQCKKRSKGGGGTCVAQLKKKCKLEHSPAVVISEEVKDSDSNNDNDNNKKKLCFEDLRLILSKNSAFQRAVFPQDEKEGAILLMALSYGLVQS